MSKYYIKTNQGYSIVDGKKTHSGFGFHKTDDGYSVTDLATGLLIVGGLKSVAKCKEYIEDKTNIDSIEERKRNRSNYSDCVDKLVKYKKKYPIKSQD